MIIQNGAIEYIIPKGGGLDATTGHPIPATEEYCHPIPCQYQARAYNAQARVDTEANTQRAYSILVEDMHPIKSERIRLTDRCGRLVGCFSIVQVKPLPAVCQYEIVV